MSPLPLKIVVSSSLANVMPGLLVSLHGMACPLHGLQPRMGNGTGLNFMGQSQFEDDFLSIQAVQPPGASAAPARKSPDRQHGEASDPTLTSQARTACGATDHAPCALEFTDRGCICCPSSQDSRLPARPSQRPHAHLPGVHCSFSVKLTCIGDKPPDHAIHRHLPERSSPHS